jgi:hypothetical protein
MDAWTHRLPTQRGDCCDGMDAWAHILPTQRGDWHRDTTHNSQFTSRGCVVRLKAVGILYCAATNTTHIHSKAGWHLDITQAPFANTSSQSWHSQIRKFASLSSVRMFPISHTATPRVLTSRLQAVAGGAPNLAARGACVPIQHPQYSLIVFSCGQDCQLPASAGLPGGTGDGELQPPRAPGSPLAPRASRRPVGVRGACATTRAGPCD